MPKKDGSRFNKRQLHKDDRGSTLVVVVVTMLMLCVLATVILYTTYVNYTIKTTELRATNNFYTAESVMDEIKAGLEMEVSNAYTCAYLYIMQNYNAFASDVLRVARFQQEYKSYLIDRFDSDGNGQMDLELLYAYLSGEHTMTDGEAVFASDGSRAKLELVSADGSLESLTNGVRIKGLRLTYTDRNGYVAVITTDIDLKTPDMILAEQGSLPGVLSYSLIADRELHFGEDASGALMAGTYTVKGSVYGGAEGIFVSHSQTSFAAAEAGGTYLVVTGGEITVTGTQNLTRNDAEFTTSGSASLWADGIVVDSSTLSLAGESHVQDDLTVNGKNSSVTLAGQYYGFGYQSVSTSARTPENSSSILINGVNVALDLQALTELSLAGQAYIGTTDVDENGVKDEGELIGEDGTVYSLADNQDVRMGESLSVRSNQLAYLVPPECIGYIDGECVLGANPVSLTRYQEFQTDREKEGVVSSQEVDLTRVEVIAGMTLSDYGAEWQKVFYQAAGSGNNAWVYYYLTFHSAAQANAFFADYYSQNKAELNTYLKNYLDPAQYHVPASIERLNLAGNAVYFDEEAGEFILQPASTADSDEDALALLAEYEGYANINKALNVNLTTNYAALTWEQIYERVTVFPNVIDVDTLREYMEGEEIKEVVATGGQKVVLVDNEDGSVYEVPEDSSIKVVIATGDVWVRNRDYKGMILSGGRIFVTGSLTLEPDPVEVGLALQADNGQLLNCFWDGQSITDSSGGASDSDGEDDTIDTGGLVVYRNWKKD